MPSTHQALPATTQLPPVNGAYLRYTGFIGELMREGLLDQSMGNILLVEAFWEEQMDDVQLAAAVEAAIRDRAAASVPARMIF